MDHGWGSAIIGVAAACSSFTSDPAQPADDAGLPNEDGGGFVDIDGSGPDTGPDAGLVLVDVTNDGVPCDYSLPYGTPMPIMSLPATDTREATLYADQLIYARGTSGSPVTLYIAVQADGGGFPKSDALVLPQNASMGSRSPSLSVDGRTLHFLARNGTGDKEQLWRLTRSGTITFAFGGASSPVNGNTTLISTFMTARALWYSQEGVSGDDVLRAPFDDAGASTAGVTVMGLKADRYPVSVSDENHVLYASRASGVGVKGGYDIWQSRRDPDASTFVEPKPVPELNSEFDDIPSWVSPDGCRILFFRAKTDAGLQHDIYFARKPHKI